VDLATIEVPADVARREYLAYRRAVREHRTAEDEQMMRAYRAAAKGQRLIRLPEVILAGGLTCGKPVEGWYYDSSRPEGQRRVPNGVWSVSAFPRLAVARADVQHVYCQGVQRDGSIVFDDTARGSAWRATRQRFELRPGTVTGDQLPPGVHEFATTTRKVAMVPAIPPALRPSTGLSNFHILWEAEWKVRPLPPVDPALLKHVGGDLYAVLAVWDLTPLEQAVLAGTRGEPTTIGT
jgi:hypothetical protein